MKTVRWHYPLVTVIMTTCIFVSSSSVCWSSLSGKKLFLCVDLLYVATLLKDGYGFLSQTRLKVWFKISMKSITVVGLFKFFFPSNAISQEDWLAFGYYKNLADCLCDFWIWNPAPLDKYERWEKIEERISYRFKILAVSNLPRKVSLKHVVKWFNVNKSISLDTGIKRNIDIHNTSLYSLKIIIYNN